jgi:hypothetical protein
MAPVMAYFSDAYVASEPISANKAQASRPYCNTATARLGASVAVAISQINQVDVTALTSITLGHLLFTYISLLCLICTLVFCRRFT